MSADVFRTYLRIEEVFHDYLLFVVDFGIKDDKTTTYIYIGWTSVYWWVDGLRKELVSKKAYIESGNVPKRLEYRASTAHVCGVRSA